MDKLSLNGIDFKIKVILPSGSELEINPVAQLIVDEQNIRQEIRELPAQFALFSSIYVKYKKNRDLTEHTLSSLRNAYAKEIRKLNNNLNNREVDEIIDTRDEIMQLKQKLIDESYYVNQLYYLIEGLEKKQKSLGALDYMNSREERAQNELTRFKNLEDNTIDNTSTINANRYKKTT